MLSSFDWVHFIITFRLRRTFWHKTCIFLHHSHVDDLLGVTILRGLLATQCCLDYWSKWSHCSLDWQTVSLNTELLMSDDLCVIVFWPSYRIVHLHMQELIHCYNVICLISCVHAPYWEQYSTAACIYMYANGVHTTWLNWATPYNDQPLLKINSEPFLLE